MKVKQLKRKMAALLAVAMVMTGQPSGVLAGGMPGDSEATRTAGTETVSTVNDANKNTKPNGSEITVATKNTANSGTVGGAGGTGTVPPKDEQDTFEVTYQVKPEEGAKVTGARTVKTGETLEFTVRVNEGYELDTVRVSGDVLEPTKEEDNKYSYEAENIMQAPEVEVTLTPGIMLLADEASPSEVYVNGGANTESGNADYPVESVTGDGTENNPYNSLAYAVKKVADGGTVYLTNNDFDLYGYVRVNKDITIDGQDFKINRNPNFATTIDNNRSWYNPAMFEVADGGKLTLKNIEVSDGGHTAGGNLRPQEMESGGGDTSKNTSISQDAIIASYDSRCEINLINTTLSDFGGMSAIRAAGGVAVSMVNSHIEGGNADIPDDENNEKAAIYLPNGSSLEMDKDSTISGLQKAHGIYMSGGASATIEGTISDIDNSGVKGRYALLVEDGSEATVNGVISGIIGGGIQANTPENGKTSKVVINGSVSDILIDLDSNYGISASAASTIELNGILSEIRSTVDGNYGWPLHINGGNLIVNSTGKIRDCEAVKDLSYFNGGSNIIIEGRVENNKSKSGAIISFWNQDSTVTIKEGALISNNTANTIVDLGGWGSKFIMEGGTITDNTSSSSVIDLVHRMNIVYIRGGIIENNNGEINFSVTFGTDDDGAGASISAGGYLTISPEAQIDDKTLRTKIERNHSAQNEEYSFTVSDYGRDVKIGVDSSGKGRGENPTNMGCQQTLENIASDINLTNSLGGFWYQGGAGEFNISDFESYDGIKDVYAIVIPTNINGNPVADAASMATYYLAEKTEDGKYHLSSLPTKSENGYAVLLAQEGDQPTEFATLGLQSLTFYAGGDYAGSEYNWSVGFPKARWTIDGQSVNDLSSHVKVNEQEWINGYPFNISFINKDTGEELTQNTSVEDIMGEYRIELAFKKGVTSDTLTVDGKPVALGSIGSLTIRPLTELGDNEAQETAGIISDVANEHPTTPIAGTALAVAEADTKYKVNNSMELAANAQPALLFDKLLDTSYETTIKEKLSELGYVPETDSAQFDMRYLDLVDANDGNVWISSSKGTDIYWPYPVEDPENYEFAIYHFKGLHREYGVQGEEDAATRIENATIEDVEEILPEAHPAGLKIHIGEAGFSPFILTYKEKAQPEPEPEPEVQHTITINYYKDGTTEKLAESQTITLDAGEPYDVTAEASKTISGYRIVRTEGIVKGDALKSNIEINVYYTRKSTGGGGGPSGSGSSGSGVAYTVGLNGNWVHMDPNDINTPISQVVPDGATPVSNPEWHQWKFILTDGSALTNRWAFIRNPYAVEGQPSEGWFSFDENGIMNYGWYLDQSTGKWYFLHRQSDGMLGTMMEGWHHDEQDGRWYYLQPGSGEMLLGWQEIGGRWYYFNPNAPQVTWNYNEATGGWTYNGSQSRPYGSMYQNEVTPDGYQVDGSGAWVQ